MIGLDTAADLVRDHGLWLLIPLSIVEGPVVTVIAAWLASLGLMNLWLVILIVIAGDMIGDVIFYAMGRRGLRFLSRRWRRRLGLSARRLAIMASHFQQNGTRTLVIAKLTHAAGAPILVAAGMARMPFLQFCAVNLIATVPKALALVALGWTFGSAYHLIDDWITRGSLIVLLVILIAVIAWYFHSRRERS
jgi:membrane protein DedA with SNARE-associated domain